MTFNRELEMLKLTSDREIEETLEKTSPVQATGFVLCYKFFFFKCESTSAPPLTSFEKIMLVPTVSVKPQGPFNRW